jgi:drug/metabolite transporter (DMT)-like permease
MSYKQLFFMAMSEVFYYGIGPIVHYKALESCTVPAVTIITQLEPVWVTLFAIVTGEKIGKWGACNVSLNFVGVLLASLIVPIFATHLGIHLQPGLLYELCSTFCFVTSLLIVKHALQDVKIGTLAGFRMMFGVAWYTLFTFVKGGQNSLRIVAGFGDAGLLFWSKMWWYGLVYSGAATALFLVAVKHCSQTMIATGMCMQFVMTFIFAIAVNGQWPSVPQCAGAGMILTSAVSGVIRLSMQGETREKPDKNGRQDGDDEVQKCNDGHKRACGVETRERSVSVSVGP